MVTSLDGKVTGNFLGKNSGLIGDYYRIHSEYGADGFLCGRVTMESSFPQPSATPSVYEGPPIERTDYVAEKAAFYAVAIDPQGKLWWGDHAISDSDEGYDGAHIVEVLTHKVSNDFLAHLRNKGISYLFGGKSELNLYLVAQKLKRLFDMEMLLLEGGGIVNGSFFQENLIDEISLVVVPEAECSEMAVPLFKTGKYHSDSSELASFRLQESKRLQDDGLWLIYKKR
jgi:riboflavin biosynthesis pyrimidine reductase